MTESKNVITHVGLFADKTPDRPAIIMGRTGEIITFAQYEAISNQCAHLLRQCGLERGDRVALLMENNARYLPLAWGGMRAGLRVTAIATHLSASEVDYILENSEAKALFTSGALSPTVKDMALSRLPENGRFILNGQLAGFTSLESALAEMPESPIADQSEGIEMLYSSGTTGQPKAVKKGLPEVPFGTPHPSAQVAARLYGFDDQTVYLSPAPLYHAAPFITNLRINRWGGTSVIMEKFDAQLALELIQKHRVTTSQWVPTHFIRMLRLPEQTREQFDLSSHRVAIHAAAPCPVQVKHQMINWWGPIVQEYYGGSEGNGYVQITSEQWLKKPGSVGQALIGKLRICDDDGKELPAGQEGAIFFEGGPVFEYYKDPEKTAASRTAKGWSTLGDVGYVDEDGYLFLTDRKAFMILSGGVNIYPQESENRLVTHPEVIDAAVFGIPNDDFGEEVKAVVQLVNHAHAGEAMQSKLIDFCREALSAVKCPRSVDFVEQLPREENGKLYKRKLRDAYWNKN
jgi:fatty-acyl-CoA synthase